MDLAEEEDIKRIHRRTIQKYLHDQITMMV